MPDSRKARRIADPGLQPERTSLAWFRTMLGYGALMALAIKHNWHQAGMLFWISIGILAIVALILWHYTRNRNLMDVRVVSLPLSSFLPLLHNAYSRATRWRCCW